jgi:hypothetical protein
MATFANDLRLKEITTGDEDGTWGTSTNTNLALIADAFSLGTKQMAADANETFTMPDATADGTRSLYLKITSAVSLSVTRTVTLAPNTVSKVWIIENATTGSQSITISQGSGATVTIATGTKAMIVTDGAGGGAAVTLANPTVSLATGVTGTLPIANGGTGTTSTTFANLTTNVTGTLPVGNGGTGITSFGSGVATWLGTPSSANLAAAVTDETGSGALVFATSPTLVTPALGTPASGVLSNTTVDGTNKVGYLNIPYVTDKTTSYSLAVGDIGEVVGVGSGGSITIPDATFAAGDAILIFNNTAGDITITCTITTAYISGTDEDKATVTLATRGLANILFISGTVCVISGNVS